MKYLLTMIAMMLILSAPAQEFQTTALDDFGTYLVIDQLQNNYLQDNYLTDPVLYNNPYPYQDYQDTYSEYLGACQRPPMPNLYQPSYTYEAPLMIIPPYWGPYWVPPVYHYGHYLPAYAPYLPQVNSYDPYLHPTPYGYVNSLERAILYNRILNILNNK